MMNEDCKSAHSNVIPVRDESKKQQIYQLGEMASLIAHDLASPLHVIKYCIDTLAEKPEKIHEPKYINFVKSNLERSLQLIESLRARVKNVSLTPEHGNFLKAHNQVITVLATQFKTDNFAEIDFDLDPAFESLVVNIPQIDLVHVLEHIYRTAVSVLINKEDKKIQIGLNRSDDKVLIRVKYNGDLPNELASPDLDMTKNIVSLSEGKLEVTSSGETAFDMTLLAVDEEVP